MVGGVADINRDADMGIATVGAGGRAAQAYFFLHRGDAVDRTLNFAALQ